METGGCGRTELWLNVKCVLALASEDGVFSVWSVNSAPPAPFSDGGLALTLSIRKTEGRTPPRTSSVLFFSLHLQRAFGKWHLASGIWQVASGKWQVASGKWQAASGKWQVASGKW